MFGLHQSSLAYNLFLAPINLSELDGGIMALSEKHFCAHSVYQPTEPQDGDKWYNFIAVLIMVTSHVNLAYSTNVLMYATL
jgi:hypothetical protein